MHASRLTQEQTGSIYTVIGYAVGLGGLEPAASSLSETDSQAPCYRASLQSPIRERHKDGVNGSARQATTLRQGGLAARPSLVINRS